MHRVLLLLLSLAILAPAARAEELNIATVDLQRALNECESGKKAKEEFKVEVDKLQAQLAKRKENLERIKADLEKKGMVLKDEERKNLEKDYQRQLRDFQRTYKDSQAELQARDGELTNEILRQLQEIIMEYGTGSPHTLILEASNTGAVLYNHRSTDITDKIIEKFNARKNGSGKR